MRRSLRPYDLSYTWWLGSKDEIELIGTLCALKRGLLFSGEKRLVSTEIFTALLAPVVQGC